MKTWQINSGRAQWLSLALKKYNGFDSLLVFVVLGFKDFQIRCT
ncbi:hypothetical protein BGP_1833 [Beggiatoa sp. PS]|nr:hypothetical protein BGP_1833 [Beggiatoa sp. PS]